MRQQLLIVLLLWTVETSAAQFESLGDSIAKVLGTQKAFQTNVGKVPVFYSKGKTGSPERIAVVHKNTYPPDCTHTWVTGLDARTSKVLEVRVVEMSCHHAYPTRKNSFLGQFKGKGPKDARSLEERVSVIAKATGSSKLAAEAVRISIETATKVKGK